MGSVDGEGAAARDGLVAALGEDGAEGEAVADVVPGGAVVTNPAQSTAPGAFFFFSLMNEPKKIINFCCARSIFLWMVFCLNIFGACCRGTPSPSSPGRRRGPGAAAVNHCGVIAVWARSPTTHRVLIGSRLRGAGVPPGASLGGLCCGVGTVRGSGSC